ncbi:MAG TPA: DNA recombination protein RmuC [Luteimonas sp.]|nr:DNA recombination protein RmuC [Luteimonas sp.]HRO25837.1 DNA recombination protein RmuC [Luteimonas sp.]HRP71581.1 DNA recombination protein RmuC [Luteimonas sp.]
MDSQTLLILAVGLLALVLALLVVLLLRRPEARLERALREEQRDGRGELRQQLDSLSLAQEQRIDGFGRRLDDLATRTDQRLDLLRDGLLEDARKARNDSAQQQKRFEEGLGQRVGELTQRNEQRIGEMRATLEQQLQRLQADNAQKLERMRETVDEKLQSTLETRLGASFKLVSERLEQVQRGLGEMQQLATGVGDLKRVLTNVKTRGIFGEVQLGALLEQVLTIEQYESNCATVPGSSERVEFAVRLPGGGDAPILLPIDAKFPREDYERLLDAQDRADVEAVNAAAAGLERQVKVEAKRIRDKYLAPPHTTDFALLFLPTEGLYAEVLRRPGLFDALQREFRVTLVGPTTLLALLNSLQMGFRTLAIEKRSSEVWQLLGTVKAEFGKFAGVLEKATTQLDTVQNSIKQAGVRTRAIEKQLKGVETLPGNEVQALPGDSGDDD